MKTTKGKYNHQYGFKLSLILSLLIFISLFAFFPNEINNDGKKVKNLFSLSDVITTPPTKQLSEKIASPKLPQIIIPVENTEDFILEDQTITKLKSYVSEKIKSKAQLNFISYQPKQTLEVLPKKISDDIKGFVKVKIKVGSDGKAQDYEILENTTQNKECIDEVITAVYKSRWETFNHIASAKEYWIEKTYRFN